MVVALPAGVPTWRPVGAHDAALLRRLFVATRADWLAGLADAGLRERLLEQQQLVQQRAYRDAWPQAEFRVVECDRQAVGRLTVAPEGAGLHLLDLAVLPEWQGRGIATALLRRLQAATAADGWIRLAVAHGNPAERLYARLGFVSLATDAVYRQMAWRAAPGSQTSDRAEAEGRQGVVMHSGGIDHVAT